MSAKRAPRILQQGMPPPKESEILAQVRQYLRLKGWYVIRIQQGIGCHKGISDLIACKGGQCVFVEVKTPRGRLSRHQETFRDEIESQGLRYVVARAVDDVRALV